MKPVKEAAINNSSFGRSKLLYQHSHKEPKNEEKKVLTKTILQTKRKSNHTEQKLPHAELKLVRDCVSSKICRNRCHRVSWDSKLPPDKINSNIHKIFNGFARKETKQNKKDSLLPREFLVIDDQTASIQSVETANINISSIQSLSNHDCSTIQKRKMNSNVSGGPEFENSNNGFNKSNSQFMKKADEDTDVSGNDNTASTLGNRTSILSATNSSARVNKDDDDLCDESEEEKEDESEEEKEDESEEEKENESGEEKEDESEEENEDEGGQEKKDETKKNLTQTSRSEPLENTGNNRLLHSPIHFDSDGLPIPVTRPGLISVPVSKGSSGSGCLCCCRKSVKSLSKKLERHEADIGKDLHQDTKLVLNDINKYRKSMRTALVDVSDTLFEFHQKFDTKSENGSQIDEKTINQLNELLLKIMSKLKVDVDWLERLVNDLRKSENKPLTVLGILHHLVHNEAILSLDSRNLVRHFRGATNNLEFHSRIRKMKVLRNITSCNGRGILKLKSHENTDSNINNNNRSGSTSENISDDKEAIELIAENLVNILKNPTLLRYVLKKILETPRHSRCQFESLNPERGDGRSSQFSEKETKTLITAVTQLSEKPPLHMNRKSRNTGSVKASSGWFKSLKKISLSSKSERKKQKLQQSSAFHSCFDKSSFHTTLFGVDSISSEGDPVIQSFLNEPKSPVSSTLVNETGSSPMFTADEFVKPNNHVNGSHLNGNHRTKKLQYENWSGPDLYLKSVLIQVINKINQLARANNRVVKRIRLLERFVGKKKSSNHKRRVRKSRNELQTQAHNRKSVVTE